MSDEPSGLPAPRANPELIGQEAAEAVLQRALGEGRLPHAWLLTGPRGIGKATLAFRFARTSSWSGPRRPHPSPASFRPISCRQDGWPVSPSTRAIRSSVKLPRKATATCMTVHAAEPTKRAPIKSVIAGRARPVRSRISFLHHDRRAAAAGGSWWWTRSTEMNAQRRQRPSQGAWKNRRADALLLLISHAPGRLLPTIRSRCCHLALSPLPEPTLIEWCSTSWHAPGPGPR